MQLVDEYMRHCQRARLEAEKAVILSLKHGFERLAEGWERLANERLKFLQEQLKSQRP